MLYEVITCRIMKNYLNAVRLLFRLFTITHNDRGYGHLRFAGAFAVVKRQGECGRKTSQLHVSQQVNIGVCYLLVFVVSVFFNNIQNYVYKMYFSEVVWLVLSLYFRIQTTNEKKVSICLNTFS